VLNIFKVKDELFMHFLFLATSLFKDEFARQLEYDEKQKH